MMVIILQPKPLAAFLQSAERNDFPHVAWTHASFSDICPLPKGYSHFCGCYLPHYIMLLPGALLLLGNQLGPGKCANHADVSLGWKLGLGGPVFHSCFRGELIVVKGIMHNREEVLGDQFTT